MTNRTSTRSVDSPIIPTPTVAPAAAIARASGTRILKKVHASRPALALCDVGPTRA